ANSGDTLNISARDIFYPQINILGSSVGSKEEFKDMYDYLIKNNIKPIIGKTLPFDKIISGLQELKESNQLGNIVIQMDI
ncbi:NAD(P)-dependent alcohol dehydrogenase, partial [Staphylococcus sp. S36]|nr:NAD(P)-dependent alcohol dehydrogenase [Staphylococcus sp. S36]